MDPLCRAPAIPLAEFVAFRIGPVNRTGQDYPDLVKNMQRFRERNESVTWSNPASIAAAQIRTATKCRENPALSRIAVAL